MIGSRGLTAPHSSVVAIGGRCTVTPLAGPRGLPARLLVVLRPARGGASHRAWPAPQQGRPFRWVENDAEIYLIDPGSAFDPTLNVRMVIMTLFGGPGTVFGPVLGSLVLSAISELLASKIVPVLLAIGEKLPFIGRPATLPIH